MRNLFGLVALGAALCAPQISAAQSQEGFRSFGVNAVVRTKCRVQVNDSSAAALVDGRVDLGQMVEGCNNMQGYRIVLKHAPNLERAALLVDGERVELSSSGETVVVDSNEAAWRQRPVSLELGSSSPMTLASLSFRMEPKGPVY